MKNVIRMMGNNTSKYFVLVFWLVIQSFFQQTASRPFPIQFSISENKIVSQFPEKNRDFAFIIPGKKNTYIYNDESKYYKDYQHSYFAITCMKGGWDCLRHYEILANGCIPYFVDIDKCPQKSMIFLPKALIWEAMHLPGVSYGKINHAKFDEKRYNFLLAQLLDHTRKYLTTRSMAKYFLDTMNYSGTGKILFLCNNNDEDYLKSSLFIGLRQNLQNKVIDFPKIDCLYKSYTENTQKLYGKGFSYAKILEDIFVDRSNIEQRIKNKEFEIIVYAYVHKGCMFYNTVQQNYSPEKIAYVCGEDKHKCSFINRQNLFLREYDI